MQLGKYTLKWKLLIEVAKNCGGKIEWASSLFINNARPDTREVEGRNNLVEINRI